MIKVIRLANGDPPADPHQAPQAGDWVQDGLVQREWHPPADPPPPQAKTQWSYHEFLTELHTPDEQARFEVAVRRAEQTPAVDLLDPANALNLAMLQFHRRALVAPWIDRTLPVTAQGLQILKAVGVYGLDPEVADARIAQVLAGETRFFRIGDASAVEVQFSR